MNTEIRKDDHGQPGELVAALAEADGVFMWMFGQVARASMEELDRKICQELTDEIQIGQAPGL
jgi:hypothetical protein